MNNELVFDNGWKRKKKEQDPWNVLYKKSLDDKELKEERNRLTNISPDNLSQSDILYAKIDELKNKLAMNNTDIDLNNLDKPTDFLKINSPYSPYRYHPIDKIYKKHDGVDLKVQQGSDVRTPIQGVVEFAGVQSGYGNVVIINHGKVNGKNIKTKYAHLSKINVKKGDSIQKGGNLGLSGGRPGTQGAGKSTGEHLHFEIIENGIPQDPMKYIKH